MRSQYAPDLYLEHVPYDYTTTNIYKKEELDLRIKFTK